MSCSFLHLFDNLSTALCLETELRFKNWETPSSCGHNLVLQENWHITYRLWRMWVPSWLFVVCHEQLIIESVLTVWKFYDDNLFFLVDRYVPPQLRGSSAGSNNGQAQFSQSARFPSGMGDRNRNVDRNNKTSPQTTPSKAPGNSPVYVFRYIYIKYIHVSEYICMSGCWWLDFGLYCEILTVVLYSYSWGNSTVLVKSMLLL